MSMFKESLSSIDWSEVYTCESANGSYDILFTKLYYNYNNCFPIQLVKQLNGNLRKPSITQVILNSVKR